MNKKLKYYFIGISFISMITCASIIPLHTSYGDNAVEQESSVSYEAVIDNRGLDEISQENSTYVSIENNQEEEMDIMSFSISSYSAEEPITGVTMSLSSISDKDIEKLTSDYMWTTDRVNLRSEASTNSDKILTLDKRTKIQMISSSNKWTKVKYEDYEGYIYSTYLRDTELPSLDFSDEEIDLLAKILWLEARGEKDDTGLAAVVIVVLNRITSVEFDDTLREVLSKKGEFSSWKLLDTAQPTEREYEIIDETLNGLWDGILTEDHVYFSTKARNNNGTIKIGNHFFCKY